MKALLKNTLIGIFTLFIIGFALHIIDYYVYSWKYFLCFGGCRSITVVEENKNLQESYDLLHIGNQLKENSNYKVGYPLTGEYTENGLYISRIFGETTYTLNFFKNVRLNLYTLDATNSGNYSGSPNYHGEPETTPNYRIRKNLEQMVDEMPLNDARKNELKSKVSIACGGGARLPS